jgi:predicted O-methyltransferase YrrM
MFRFHHDFLQFLKHIVRPEVYLEIGVATGVTLFGEPRASTLIGVDPDPHLTIDPSSFSWNGSLFRETSDAFFERSAIKEVTDKPVDLTFVDGMHWAEFALRDIRNAESISDRHGVIAVHDIYPKSSKEASREFNREGDWMGDVFKATHALRKFRPDLKMVLISDIPPSGMAVIYKLDPFNRMLFDRYDEVVDYMMTLDYERDFSTKVLPTFASEKSDVAVTMLRDLLERRYSEPRKAPVSPLSVLRQRIFGN